MALNPSGPISLGGSTAGESIALELGLSATGTISLNDTAVRGLAGVASGAIVMPTDFYGKSNIPGGAVYVWGTSGPGSGGGIMGLNGYNLTISTPTQLGASTNWYQVKFSPYFGTGASAIATTSDGKLFTWGSNYSGKLGLNLPTNFRASSPIQVGALTNWGWVDAGRYAMCGAVKRDGTLWMWGYRFSGQLGINLIENKSSPVQVGALTNWKSVHLNSSCFAIKTDGTLWTWGRNINGSSGTNNSRSESSPVQIGSLTHWKYIYQTRNFSTHATTTSNTLFGWGANYNGVLGLNNDTAVSSPTQVGALTNWKIPSQRNSSGAGHIIKTDGTLWFSGFGYYGNAGASIGGGQYRRSSPIQVGVATNWRYACTSDNGFSCAVRTDGTWWRTGRGLSSCPAAGGGPGSNYTRSSFVQMGTITTWRKPWIGRWDTASAVTGILE